MSERAGWSVELMLFRFPSARGSGNEWVYFGPPFIISLFNRNRNDPLYFIFLKHFYRSLLLSSESHVQDLILGLLIEQLSSLRLFLSRLPRFPLFSFHIFARTFWKGRNMDWIKTVTFVVSCIDLGVLKEA